jgi:hypothetical protein
MSQVKNANVLVLCSSQSSIINYKSVQVLKELCEKTDEIKECKNWTKLSFYYAGVDIPESFDNSRIVKEVGTITSNNVVIGEKNISLSHNILPHDVGNIKENLIVPYTQEYNINFDIIVNENCPRKRDAVYADYELNPSDLIQTIFATLKEDGYYIDKFSAIQHLSGQGFQNLYQGLKLLTHGNISIETDRIKVQDWAILKPKSEEEEKDDIIRALELSKVNFGGSKKKKRRKKNKRKKSKKKTKRRKNN